MSVKDDFLEAMGGLKDRLLEGAEADKDKYLEVLAKDYALAASQGDTEGMREVFLQGKALAGAHRVAVKDAIWDAVFAGLKIGLAAI